MKIYRYFHEFSFFHHFQLSSPFIRPPTRALFIEKVNQWMDEAVPINQQQRVRNSLIRAYDEKYASLILEYLNLTSIDDLVDCLRHLPTLTELNLSHNHLETLPESFSALTKLQYLNLTNNKLQTLPESFGNLTALRDLYLSGNPLTSLPNSILTLPHQCTVRLQDHALSEEVIASLQSATTAPPYLGPTISFSLPHHRFGRGGVSI